MTALVLRALSTALWLVLNVFLARTLPTGQLSLVLYVINASLLLAHVTVMGFNTPMLRAGARHWQLGERGAFRALLFEARAVVAGAVLVLALGLAFLAALNLTGPLSGFAGAAVALGVATGLTAMMIVQAEALRATGQLARALVGVACTRIVATLGFCGAFWIIEDLSAVTVLLSYCAALALAAGCEAVWLARACAGQERQRGAAKAWREALVSWPGEVGGVTLMRGSVVVLGAAGDLSLVAVFLIADRVATLSRFPTDAVRAAAAPRLARAAPPGRADETLQRAVSETSGWFVLAGGAGLASVALTGGGLLAIFGPEFRDGLALLWILLLAHGAWVVFGPTGLVLSMAGLSALRSGVTCGVAVLMLVAQIVLLPVVGVLGLAALFCTACWVLNSALWLVIRLRLGVRCGLFGVRLSEFLHGLRSTRIALAVERT